jgi:hypothetical protein
VVGFVLLPLVCPGVVGPAVSDRCVGVGGSLQEQRLGAELDQPRVHGRGEALVAAQTIGICSSALERGGVQRRLGKHEPDRLVDMLRGSG